MTAPDLVETRVLRLAAEAFGRKVEIDDDFFDIGADSLSITLFAQTLSTEFGRDVDPANLFYAGTIRSALAEIR